jgi:hypothetical protein
MKTLLSGVAVFGSLLIMGFGCAEKIDLFEKASVPGNDRETVGKVQGDSDYLPDGKGAGVAEFCMSVESVVKGPVWVYAANKTSPRENWSQWFSASPVVVGDAGKELCAPLNFALESGDELVINGAWQNGKKFLVYNGNVPTDVMKEIWLNDQFYDIGKECWYEGNGKGGYNIVCTVR